MSTPPAERASGDRASVLGCEIDRLTPVQTVERVRAIIESGRSAQQVSINAAKIVALREDPELRRVVRESELVNADGQSVVWASRLLGDPLPSRVPGIDLMDDLLTLAESEGYRVYILGAREDVLRRAAQNLRRRHPRLELAGCHHGYFTDDESPRIAEAIRRAEPHMLFVAMSSPRKEHWLGAHGEELGIPFRMGVGGSIDVAAGVTERAPRVWQTLGMEWAYRLLQEPERMWRRYLISNTKFIVLIARELLARRRRRR